MPRAVDEIYALISGIAVGLFGGVGLERYRDARKDHEHRQGYYHRYLQAADAYSEAASGVPEAAGSGAVPEPSGYVPDLSDLEDKLAAQRQGIEVFGASEVVSAIEALEAVLGERSEAERDARAALVAAMRRDVAPRRRGLGRRG